MDIGSVSVKCFNKFLAGIVSFSNLHSDITEPRFALQLLQLTAMLPDGEARMEREYVS